MEIDQTIVRAAVHPAIGVARVGNSKEEFFIGPEIPYPTADPTGGYKDPSGALKRQAARFRIYGYNKEGKVVAELNSENAEIEWFTHVANKKASWYKFTIALDIPEASDTSDDLRNNGIRGNERKSLMIDPGPASIKGTNQKGPKFDKGKFRGESVYLGELRTDERGNLIFLGGHGVAGSPEQKNLTTFANNDGWFDDTSDGPVKAKVIFNGSEIPVDPSWVVVAPPNYAPDLVSVHTMYDIVHEASEIPNTLYHTKPSFAMQILPLLRQFVDTSWVNFGFHVQFGWGAPYDFLNADFIKKLATNREDKDYDEADQELRRQIFNMFRSQNETTLQTEKWPQIYGDSYGDVDSSPRARLSVTKTLYRYLEKWVEGDFIADYDPNETHPKSIDEVPLEDRPKFLDRAALHFCMGGPFHPGCEMTWPMRHASMYSGPYRIEHRKTSKDKSVSDEEIELQGMYGLRLTPKVVLSAGGPLDASSPGDITKWMAVPWQTDTASCRAGYEPEYDPYLPTFWPSRVPNHVLTEDDYKNAIDTGASIEDRLKSFEIRAVWIRWLEGSGIDQLKQMVTDFGRFGIVKKRRGADDVSRLPNTMYVESEVGFEENNMDKKHNSRFQEGRSLRFTREKRLGETL